MEARLTLALVLAACASNSSPPPSNKTDSVQPALITDATAATAALGTRVRVEGKAANDKLSAVVETGQLSVYCLDMKAWPEAQVGTSATVEGTLERTEEFQSRTNGGLVSQGTSGAIFVIRKCTVVR